MDISRDYFKFKWKNIGLRRLLLYVRFLEQSKAMAKCIESFGD